MPGRPAGRIYAHLDYRAYLKERYAEAKARNPRFSMRAFSTKAGFKAKDFLFRVMQGEKNLSQASIFMLAEVLGLKPDETDYFESLVMYAQSDEPGERDHHLQRVAAQRSEKLPGDPAAVAEVRQYEYYSRWWHSAVRSQIDMRDFGGDWAALGRSLEPAITAEEAAHSVSLLRDLGLVAEGAGGRLRLTHKVLTTGTPAIPQAILKFQRTAIALSARALEEVPADERDISCLTLGVSARTRERIQAKLRRFRRELLRMAEEDPGADTVYHLNLHAFPLSRK